MMLYRHRGAGTASSDSHRRFSLDGLRPMRLGGTSDTGSSFALKSSKPVLVILLLLLGLLAWRLTVLWTDHQIQSASLQGLDEIAPSEGPSLGSPADLSSEEAPDFLSTAATEITARQAALATRESEVASREEALRKLAGEVHRELLELQALRTEQTDEEAKLAQDEEDRAAKLARLYESMKPKKAASILDGMPTDEVASITRRMQAGKAAAVIQQMSPVQASALSERLTRE